MNAFTRWTGRAFAVALATTLLTGTVYAQPGRAEIKGQVLANRPGEEPAPLPGVTVELRQPDGSMLEGAPFNSPRTGENGKFSFVEVPTG